MVGYPYICRVWYIPGGWTINSMILPGMPFESLSVLKETAEPLPMLTSRQHQPILRKEILPHLFFVRLHLQQMDIIPSPGFEKEVVWMTFWRGSDFFFASHLLKIDTRKKNWRTFLWFVWVVEPWLLNPVACDRIQKPPKNGWNFWMILDHPKVDSNFQRFFQRF